MKVKYTINWLIGSLKDAIFPNVCICGKWGEALCEECKGKIFIYYKELCPKCGRLSDQGKICDSCRPKSHLTGVLVLGKYKDDLKRVIWRYKYEFAMDLAKDLASLLYIKYSQELINKQFLVTAVPLSTERKNWRGFNQSELVARELARLTGLEYRNILSKAETRQQVGLKRKERINNINNKIMPTIEFLDKRKIIIVDDVITIGATLEECAKVLRRLGAREVWGLVLARE